MTISPSTRQIEVYRFSWTVSVGVPALAVFFQAFVSSRVSFFAMIDLPLLVTIFFALARRSQVAGLLTGGFIGLVQDALTHLSIGINGIAKTVVGYMASSVGAKIDVENPGSRLLMTFVFYIAHQVIYFVVRRGLVGEMVAVRWGHMLGAAVLNAVVAVFLFAILDRSKHHA